MVYVKLKESNKVSVQHGWFHFGKKIDFKFDFLELCSRSLLYGKELIASEIRRCDTFELWQEKEENRKSVVKS